MLFKRCESLHRALPCSVHIFKTIGHLCDKLWANEMLLDLSLMCPDSKTHGANMGPTWVLSARDGPHVGPMNLAIRGDFSAVIPYCTAACITKAI